MSSANVLKAIEARYEILSLADVRKAVETFNEAEKNTPSLAENVKETDVELELKASESFTNPQTINKDKSNVKEEDSDVDSYAGIECYNPEDIKDIELESLRHPISIKTEQLLEELGTLRRRHNELVNLLRPFEKKGEYNTSVMQQERAVQEDIIKILQML